jgi:hypothetical protein
MSDTNCKVVTFGGLSQNLYLAVGIPGNLARFQQFGWMRSKKACGKLQEIAGGDIPMLPIRMAIEGCTATKSVLTENEIEYEERATL